MKKTIATLLEVHLSESDIIEALSLEDQALLFEQLYRQRIERQCQEKAKETAEIIEVPLPDNTPATSKFDQPQNPFTS